MPVLTLTKAAIDAAVGALECVPESQPVWEYDDMRTLGQGFPGTLIARTNLRTIWTSFLFGNSPREWEECAKFIQDELERPTADWATEMLTGRRRQERFD